MKTIQIRIIYLLLIILISNVNLVKAQNTYPLTGQIMCNRDTTGNGAEHFIITTKLVFPRNQTYPNSVKLKSSYDTVTLNLYHTEMNCDSTLTAFYNGTYSLLTQGTDFRFIGSPRMFFSGLNTISTVNFNMNTRADIYFGGGGPEIISSVIDVRPDEQFNGGLYKKENILYDSYKFKPFLIPQNNLVLYSIDSSIYVNQGHGIVSMKSPHLQGIYQFSPEIDFLEGHKLDQPIMAFRVDSNVKSTFVVNPATLDNHGQSGIILNNPGMVHYAFSFVDPGVQHVDMEWYTTLDRFDEKLQPTIVKKQSGDSTYIEMDVSISDYMYSKLPGAFNLLFTSSKSGRPCQNRLFSFYIASTAQVGLAEKVANQRIQVFPNPVEDKLMIKNAPNGTTTVCDLLGRPLLTTQEKEIDMASFQSGLYIVMFTALNGDVISTTKIMKK